MITYSLLNETEPEKETTRVPRGKSTGEITEPEKGTTRVPRGESTGEIKSIEENKQRREGKWSISIRRKGSREDRRVTFSNLQKSRTPKRRRRYYFANRDKQQDLRYFRRRTRQRTRKRGHHRDLQQDVQHSQRRKRHRTKESAELTLNR